MGCPLTSVPRKTSRFLAWVTATGKQSPPEAVLLAAMLDGAVLPLGPPLHGGRLRMMMPATVPGSGTRSPRAAGALTHFWGDLKGDGC